MTEYFDIRLKCIEGQFLSKGFSFELFDQWELRYINPSFINAVVLDKDYKRTICICGEKDFHYWLHPDDVEYLENKLVNYAPATTD